MAIKVLEADELLKNTYGSELARYVTDYQHEYERILEKRQKEFSRNKQGISISWKKLTTEDNFPYQNRLETEQTYTVPGNYGIGGVRITIEQIPLPVTENTEARKAEVSFPAEIPCGCWSGARSALAKDCGVEVRPLKHVGGTDYYDAFCKGVTELGNLLIGIESVSSAVYRLNAGLKAETKNKFDLTKI